MPISLVVESPRHSLDPADWWMYCDLLQEQGEEQRLWADARRVGDSLAGGPALTVVLHCRPERLEGHWLQIGRTWFIPVEGTRVAYVSDFLWWRPDWVRAGFARYPAAGSPWKRVDPEGMIAYATGTPFAHGYADYPSAREKFGDLLIERFFQTHALTEQPSEWT